MKKYIACIALAAAVFCGCQKTGVKVKTELTPDVFPQTQTQLVSVLGSAYAALRGNYALDYYFMQSLTTDEAILPARGGNWYDPANGYNNLHYHNWTRDNGWTNTTWTWLSTVVGVCNSVTNTINASGQAAVFRQSSVAELKVVRDLAYFMLMDLYGSAPLDTVYGDFRPHTNVSRLQLFTFIESDLKAALPDLTTDASAAMYGRANRYTAWALLAKMYLNSEYYTGTARYDDCVAACDSVIGAGGGGQYTLAGRGGYLQMFYPTNGPGQKEFIFAIPYDPNATPYPGTNGFNYRARYDLNRNLGMRYHYSGSTPGSNIDPIVNLTTGGGLVNSKPSGPESTLYSYWSACFTDPGDVRNGQWLTGPQYNADGTALMVKTTRGGSQGYDATYQGTDKSATYIYQLNLTPQIVFRTDPNSGANPSLFDLGNDEIAWNMGYRNIKYYPDSINVSSRNQNNDMPVFRYADILLMKAEAILRGAASTRGQTALSLVNQLRAARTTSPAWTHINLDSVYNERCRELSYETWHRNDMIRYGKYEGAWGFKTDSDPNHRIFPIPSTAMLLNPALKQNPGYN